MNKPLLCRDVQNMTGESRCGSSGTIRCHHFILHQDRELSVRSHENKLGHKMMVKIFCSVSRSRQTATWTRDIRGTRGTCLQGGKTVCKWPVWKPRKTHPSYVPVNNLGMFGFKGHFLLPRVMSSRFTFWIRHKSSQACSAARAINKGRRRIIKVLSNVRSGIVTISTPQMLVLMLAVYYLCWGSWLASKMIVWWARDTDIPFTKMFYRWNLTSTSKVLVSCSANNVYKIYLFLSISGQ